MVHCRANCVCSYRYIYLSIYLYIHTCTCVGVSTSSVSTSKQYSFCHGGSVCFVSAQLPDHGSFVALVLPMEYSYFIFSGILVAPGMWIRVRDAGRGTPPDIKPSYYCVDSHTGTSTTGSSR